MKRQGGSCAQARGEVSQVWIQLAGSQAEEAAGAKAERGREPLKATEPPAITLDSHIHLWTQPAVHLEVTSNKTHPPPTFPSFPVNP